MKSLSISCIDGRETSPVAGAPGGDTGEWILLLAAIERATGRDFDRAALEAKLDAQIEALGPMYLHTDDASDEPDYVGCGHLRLLQQHPAEYGARADLVREALGAVHRRREARPDDIRFVTLAGDHEESAVLIVKAPGIDDRAPLIRPCRNGVQCFVVHTDAARLRRQARAEIIEGIPRAAVLEAAERLGSAQLGTTASELAAMLPTFTVEFAADGTYEVSA